MEEDYNIVKRDGLIIVDVQNDFCTGGALPVHEGERVVPFLNEYIKLFKKAQASVVATRDWHPLNHISFKAQGGPWPSHCVQNTKGAEFHSNLQLPKSTTVVSKGINPNEENYSGFEKTELEKTLRNQGVERIFVGGLATDYCVKNTVLDGLRLGFEIVLLLDAIAGINAKLGDVESAINEMVKSGAEQATLRDFIYPLELPSVSNTDSERLADRPISKFESKKKARMRPRGPYKRIRSERG